MVKTKRIKNRVEYRKVDVVEPIVSSITSKLPRTSSQGDIGKHVSPEMTTYYLAAPKRKLSDK